MDRDDTKAARREIHSRHGSRPVSGSIDDTLLSDLMAEARRRFGAERAAALASGLERLAADLARVAEAPLPAEGEPGFFLVEGSP